MKSDTVLFDFNINTELSSSASLEDSQKFNLLKLQFENKCLEAVALLVKQGHLQDRLRKLPQLLSDAAEEALRNYRLTYMQIEDDGDAYPLLDLLSGDSGTVKQGQEEMDMLVDAVCGDILSTAKKLEADNG